MRPSATKSLKQVVETVVATKLTEVDRLWTKLNEFDVNQKLSDLCMPPAVLKYGLVKLNRCLSFFMLTFIFIFQFQSHISWLHLAFTRYPSGNTDCLPELGADKCVTQYSVSPE
jgi:hypothetical protein